MALRPVVGGRCCPVSAGTGGRGRRRRRPRPPRPRLPLTETRWRQAKSRGGQEGPSERAKRFPGPHLPIQGTQLRGAEAKTFTLESDTGPGVLSPKNLRRAFGARHKQPTALGPKACVSTPPPLWKRAKPRKGQGLKGLRAKEAILGGDSRRETPRSSCGRPGGCCSGRPSGSCEVR
jgi:hypothetical protein